jgi:hypothetical protein
MGWRERDYARFTNKEWNSYVGRGDGGQVSRPSSPGRRSSPLRQPVGWPLLAAVGISALSFFGWGHISSYLNPSPDAVSSQASAAVQPAPTPAVPAPDGKVISIRWNNTDLAPAPQAGRICVRDANHGQICASYVIGERPADTLTRRIESLGFGVASSG